MHLCLAVYINFDGYFEVLGGLHVKIMQILQ